MAVKDGDWTLQEWDPVTGRTVWSMFDERGNAVFRTDMPVDNIIEENRAALNSADTSWRGDYHRVASVPMQLLYDQRLGLNDAIMQGDDKYVSRWLNDADNRAWRTKSGTV